MVLLYIPKTAGFFINAVYTEALGSSNVLTHAENQNDSSASQALAGEAKFLSGHFCWSDWVASLGPTHKEVVKITLLRKPVDQLSSHLRWLDHYNLPQTVNERSLFPEDVLNEIDHIGRVDFDLPDSVDAYLMNLSEVGTRLFDNCQSRYFVARLFAPMNSPIHTDRIDWY